MENLCYVWDMEMGRKGREGVEEHNCITHTAGRPNQKTRSAVQLWVKLSKC